MAQGGGSARGPLVIFAGGGTGGHLYPGLAIAEAIRAREMSAKLPARCLFVCSDRPLDAEILRKAGVEFVASPAKPLTMRPRGLVRFLRTWGRAVREARGVIRAGKNEAGASGVVVVAMGGFVAAPVAQAARVERVPLLLVNLDAVPGKANRFVAWRARQRARLGGVGAGASGGPVMSTIPVKGDAAGAWPTIGPIVRESARAKGGVAACRERLGLDADAPVLMVTGGSQGAKSINMLMVELARREAALFREWQVLHQCGKGEVEAVRGAYEEVGVRRAVVEEFSDRMGDWWGAAELAVSRSGAGSVAEAWANRTPSVFLPYPYHKDEHQRWNAEPLAACGGAVLGKDAIDAEANAAGVGREIVALMRDPGRRAAMRSALARLGAADGAGTAVERVLGMLRR